MEQPGTGSWPEMRLGLPGDRAGNGSVERGARGRVRTPHPGASGPRPPPLRGAAFDGWTRRRYEGRKPLRLGSPMDGASRPDGPGLRPRAPFGSTVPRFEDAASGAPGGARAFTERAPPQGGYLQGCAARRSIPSLLRGASSHSARGQGRGPYPGRHQEQGRRSVGFSRRSASAKAGCLKFESEAMRRPNRRTQYDALQSAAANSTAAPKRSPSTNSISPRQRLRRR